MWHTSCVRRIHPGQEFVTRHIEMAVLPRLVLLAALAALSLQAEARVKPSFLSNRRDAQDLCSESVVVGGVSCVGVPEGTLGPHPADCRLFYQCARGVAFCMRCPAGLHFNPVLQVCDNPEDAGCAVPSST